MGEKAQLVHDCEIYTSLSGMRRRRHSGSEEATLSMSVIAIVGVGCRPKQTRIRILAHATHKQSIGNISKAYTHTHAKESSHSPLRSQHA